MPLPQDRNNRAMMERYIQATGIPAKHGLTVEKVVDLMTDCSRAMGALLDAQARLKPQH